MKTRVRIALRPTHGTASQVAFPSALPANRREQEVFWAKTLLSKVDDVNADACEIQTNPDDSDGNHDVIIKLVDGKQIGVQVTELTYELQRNRAHMRERYIERLLDALREQNVMAPAKTLIQLFFTAEPRDIGRANASHLVTQIHDVILSQAGRAVLPTEFGQIVIEQIASGDFYVPTYGSIGLDVNFDQIPYSIETYTSAIDHLREKKSRSRSQWLLIWSLEFARDKHWLGEAVLAHMKSAFQSSNFERVFFLESIGADRFFEPNLSIYRIKPAEVNS